MSEGERNDDGGEAPWPDHVNAEKENILLQAAKKQSVITRLRNYFLAGVIVAAPIGLTIYLTLLVIQVVDAQIVPLIPPRYNPETYLPFSIPGLGLIVMIAVLTLIGFLAANLFGRLLIQIGERIVNRMPVVRSLYNGLKQIAETVLQQSSNAFRQVVMVEYPRRGIWALAFLTSETEGEVQRRTDDQLVSVFLPTTPNPTSGFLLLVPKEDVIYLDMTVEEAAKMIISAGVVVPPDRTAPAATIVPGPTMPMPLEGERRREPAE
ncbi:MAG: DUF502 domain-containing protein [Alphaproteobacteria bacterium]|jgi:uncharacterized membrane protein|nr:DUF502 domain-containing protein [Alphaproteobacteria bacterium]